MKQTDMLDKLRKRRDKCFGFCNFRGKRFYAISGFDYVGTKFDDNLETFVENIIGFSSRILINESFTFFPHLFYYFEDYFNLIEDNFYQELYKENKKYFDFSNYCLGKIDYQPTLCGSVYSMRIFSCVERKLLGHFHKSGYIPKIFVSFRPCFLCLPVIKNVVYYDKVKKYIFEISRQDKPFLVSKYSIK